MASIEAAKRAFAEEEAAQRRRHRTARERKSLDGGALVLGDSAGGGGGGEGSKRATESRSVYYLARLGRLTGRTITTLQYINHHYSEKFPKIFPGARG